MSKHTRFLFVNRYIKHELMLPSSLFGVFKRKLFPANRSDLSIDPSLFGLFANFMRNKPIETSKVMNSLIICWAISLVFTIAGAQTKLNSEHTYLQGDTLFSDSDSLPFTGMVYSHYATGGKKSHIYYTNGIRDGDYLIWHKNGNRWLQGVFSKGDTVGVFTVRYKNDQTKLTIEFNEHGLRHGRLKKYYSDGTQRSLWLYENGKPKEQWIYSEGRVVKKKKF